jgi:hypothetical protein
MTLVLLAVCLLALVISATTALALVEVYEGLRQVRQISGLDDVPQDIPLTTVGTAASALGLDDFFPLDAGILLFLSPRCATCHTIADSFGGSVPDQTHVVITATDGLTARRWAQDYGLPDPRVTFDDSQALADQIGIDSTPSAVMVHQGMVARAATVPSRRVLDELLREARSGMREVQP